MVINIKEKYKIAVIESIPYMVVIVVIGLALYLNALIVQDTITLEEAEIIGYVLLTIVIGMEIFSLILLKVKEIDIREGTSKIEELEKELERIKSL